MSSLDRVATPGVLSVLLGAAIAAGFVIFPGCSRCCERPAATTTSSAPAQPVAGTPSPAAPVAAPGATAHGAPADAHPAPPDGVSPGDALAASRIHNYFRLSPRLASGASPETEADFDALKAAGITAIVSVDGGRPMVEAARKRGIRYVHLPIGYDGISESRALELAKTFQALAPSGPIFVHCHHGKHRGPAACSIARIVLDGIDGKKATEEMKRAGTAPKYRGLYDSILGFTTPDAATLASVSADLPEVTPAPAMQGAMVAIDATWERMTAVKKSKWASPADHPDVDPPHEATILAEHFRELARHPDVAGESEGFKTHLSTSEDASWALAKALEKGKLDAAAAESAFKRVADSCTACHAAHRDNTHRR